MKATLGALLVCACSQTTTVDAGSDAAKEAAGPLSFYCGTNTPSCQNGQICCANFSATSSTSDCRDPTACQVTACDAAGTAVPIACDSVAQCQAGSVCCGTTCSGSLLQVQCAATCNAPSVTVCSSDAIQANQCGTCGGGWQAATGLPVGYMQCASGWQP